MAADRWERRQGDRQGDGWRWYAWKLCTEAEAQRVTGLQSWQVRQVCVCTACEGRGYVPAGVSMLRQVPLQQVDLSAQRNRFLTAPQVDDKLAHERSKFGVREVGVGVTEDHVQHGQAEVNVHGVDGTPGVAPSDGGKQG